IFGKLSSERSSTVLIVAAITLASTAIMLVGTSPEFSWDEADYLNSMNNSWGRLRRPADYSRHSHGPVFLYLTKLGYDFLPSAIGWLEGRYRFFVALFASLG